MSIEYTGRQAEVTPELRALAEKKLKKLQRVLHGITHAHVILSADKHRQAAEVSVHSGRLDLTAAEETGDLATSLSTVLDKLTRQAHRHMGKRQQGKRRGPSRSAGMWVGGLAAEAASERPRVVRSRRFAVKPMTVDEAVLEMGAREEGLVVFRDAATKRVHVLYKRKDGNLGLIEPEV